MKYVFLVIGDIHGDLNKLNTVLEDNPLLDNQKYVFVGDYIDRGKYNLEVIQKMIELVNSNQAICLLGNHDEVFYKVIMDVSYNKPNLFLYYDFIVNYQIETFNSFLKGSKYNNYGNRLKWLFEHNEFEIFSNDLYQMCTYIKQTFTEELDFLKSCPIYIETENYVISHSGGNKKINIKDVSVDEWLWNRDFTQPINNKKYIFGHTPTLLNCPQIKGNNINVDSGAIFSNNPLVVYQTKPNEIISIGKSHL